MSVRSSITQPAKIWRVAWYVLAIALLATALSIRVRLRSMPLERDEGEYAYAGQLMLQGVPPYKLAYNMKFPGTYAAYAGIMALFGQTVTALRSGLVLINAATIVLIFFLGRRLIDSTAAITAATSYAILSVSPSLLGFAGHASHFVILPVLGGAFLLLTEKDRQPLRSLFGSGLLFGTGLLMKQPAIFFVVSAALYLIWDDLWRGFGLRRVLLRNFIFAAGAILPFALTCLILWHAGVFNKFWFWTIMYARQYAGLVPFSRAPAIFIQNVTEAIGAAWPLWTLAGVGLLTGLFSREMRRSTLFLLNLFVVSALAVSAGFYFRHHYFIIVLPAVSLFIGLAMSRLSDFTARRIKVLEVVPLLLFAAATGGLLFGEREFFFQASPTQACRMIYGSNPFVESVRIADYLREQTSPSETIAVLGSEPEIYFYTNRHSATGYIYMYGLMEPQGYARQMQEEMIREIEHARPKYLVLIAMKFSWLQRPQSDRMIFTWANDYTARNYALDGFVNSTVGEIDYFFGGTPPSTDNLQDYILIYKRRL
jgi:hypothetical protein